MKTPPASMDWIQQLTAPPLDTLYRTELILPQQANPYGTLFAPEALALLGRTAYLAARQFSGQAVVMAAAQEIKFLKPVVVGALLHVHARVVRVGRSSMTIEVHAALDAAPGTGRPDALRGSFEMVAVDAAGRPVAIRAEANLTAPVC
ncbi:acyl-CoA thioesterase [Roseateles cellulosilyticus]|uniref:Acyl-CoA thioesterase n=1 Tax=Pelomonas cellulosilytica TaxID=2906762 RepID=A0ABS8XQN7_9BURK|nr:acyl-CoA thioesterase [Pelomonas sp. P8]MCE4552906.1 acyl-CoA thioesterase [Pelomonas sp. P8]